MHSSSAAASESAEGGSGSSSSAGGSKESQAVSAGGSGESSHNASTGAGAEPSNTSRGESWGGGASGSDAGESDGSAYRTPGSGNGRGGDGDPGRLDNRRRSGTTSTKVYAVRRGRCVGLFMSPARRVFYFRVCRERVPQMLQFVGSGGLFSRGRDSRGSEVLAKRVLFGFSDGDASSTGRKGSVFPGGDAVSLVRKERARALQVTTPVIIY